MYVYECDGYGLDNKASNNKLLITDVGLVIHFLTSHMPSFLKLIMCGSSVCVFVPKALYN